MIMNLKIEFAENLVSLSLIRQKNIPCLCRVSGSLFEVVFQSPLQDVVGVVDGWDRKLLEERAVVGAGGSFTHYKHGMVTLSEIQMGLYKIIDLSFFYSDYGWCPILIGGVYAPPGNFLDDEREDTIGRL